MRLRTCYKEGDTGRIAEPEKNSAEGRSEDVSPAHDCASCKNDMLLIEMRPSRLRLERCMKAIRLNAQRSRSCTKRDMAWQKFSRHRILYRATMLCRRLVDGSDLHHLRRSALPNDGQCHQKCLHHQREQNRHPSRKQVQRMHYLRDGKRDLMTKRKATKHEARKSSRS